MRVYENIFKTSDNRLPQRCYYIPRGISEYNLLNGTWNFRYFERDIDIPENIDRWDSIAVPSCWQNEGFGNPNYTNYAYPYPVDPPYVPDDNPCGVYERTFEIEKLWGKVYFVLEGVSSCGFVYVNGKYAGFTQGSHLQAEFDITPFVCEGTNTLRVKVLKWCVGSYFEDQDFFRMNGIFRDCYILQRPSNHITDIEVVSKDGKVIVNAGKDADITLTDMQGKVIGKAIGTDTAVFDVDEPILWNAEKPYLYTVTVERDGEIITQRTAFREISVSDKLELLINGVPVKLRGVNHHDTHPKTGWYQNDAHIRRDLELMKELNINCIRTSHYPPPPYLVELCDEMGFYVILETDIEQHGFGSRNPNFNHGRYDTEHIDWPCAKPDWEKEHIERMQRAVYRDRNHPSIIMWSTGNESGHGICHVAMVDWLRTLGDGRLVHCEDASRKRIIENADVFSMMYSSLGDLEKFVEDKEINAPVFLCEYIHAMGNGPGDAVAYNELFDKHPKLIGGCVWEWADHTVLDENGVQRYGGDFEGELTHDHNFCCDGMVFSDRSFKAGTLEIKYAYQPMWTDYSNGVLTVRNRLSFTNLSEYEFKYTVEADGEKIEEKVLGLDVAPLTSKDIEFAVSRRNCKYGLYLNCYLLKDGKEVAHTQHEIPFNKVRDYEQKEYADIFDDGMEIVASGKGFKYTVSKHYGTFTSMIVGGQEQLADRFHLTSWIAPIDNHRHIRKSWFRETEWATENINLHFEKVYSCELIGNVIYVKGSLAGVSRKPYYNYDLKIEIFEDGKINLYMQGDVREHAPWLPRLGFEIALPFENASFKYYGNGPCESYIDMCHAGSIGMYSSTADNEYVHYARPQEHGNHTSTNMLQIGRLCFEGEGFDCNVSSYSTRALFDAEHTDELIKDGNTHLRIDYKVSGVGSASCGPQLDEKYRLKEKEISFAFSIMPIR